MRICFISDWGSVHCKRWARAMTERGHEVHVFSPFESVCASCAASPKREEVNLVHAPPLFAASQFQSRGRQDSLLHLTDDGDALPRRGLLVLHHLPLYPHRHHALSRPLVAARNVARIRRILARLKPDIVHLLGLFPVLHPCLAPAVFRLPGLVISTWGSDIVWDPPEAKPLAREPFLSIGTKRFILRQAHAITATSRFQATVTQKYAPPWLTVQHIPYGVALDVFNPERYPKRPNEPLVIAYVKSVAPKYGPDIALAAFHLVKSEIRDACMIMAGDGPMLGTVRRIAAELRVNDSVTFLGRVKHEEVPAVLASADMFVMPSVCEETFGVVALEAAAMELPVIASKVGGVNEVVVDGMTGLLVPPRDTRALAHAIVELSRDRARMKAMGQAGREFVAKNYSWEKCVDAMEEVYRLVMRRSVGRP